MGQLLDTGWLWMVTCEAMFLLRASSSAGDKTETVADGIDGGSDFVSSVLLSIAQCENS